MLCISLLPYLLRTPTFPTLTLLAGRTLSRRELGFGVFEEEDRDGAKGSERDMQEIQRVREKAFHVWAGVFASVRVFVLTCVRA